MKIIKISAATLLLAVLVGCNGVTSESGVSAQTVTAKAKSSELLQNDSAINDQATEANDDYIFEKPANHKIKLIETGEFHGHEVAARSGEIWLGLFKNKDRFFLASARIRVSRVSDEIVDAQTSEKTGKRIVVNNPNKAVFLLKNADTLKPGSIETLFYNGFDNTSSEQTSDGLLENNSSINFKLNGKAYTLKVTNENANGEQPSFGLKAVLVSEGVEQVLYAPKETREIWHLYWAGDLDRDGQLDLYMNLTDHYNLTHRRLFLSSEAEEGKLVKEVASFYTTGC